MQSHTSQLVVVFIFWVFCQIRLCFLHSFHPCKQSGEKITFNNNQPLTSTAFFSQVDCFCFVMVAIDTFISDAASFFIFGLTIAAFIFKQKKQQSTFDVDMSFLDAC